MSKKSKSIVDAECLYENGKFVLSIQEGCLPDLLTVRFRAPADYQAGDVIVFKGMELPVRTPGMESAATDTFKAGAVVHCDIDAARKLAFFWLSGGGVAGGIMPNLSTTEQFAGFYDTDGSKVYVKRIEIGPLVGSKNIQIPHGIPKLKKIIFESFICENANGWITPNRYSPTGPLWVVFSYLKDCIDIHGSYNYSDAWATLFYTREE